MGGSLVVLTIPSIDNRPVVKDAILFNSEPQPQVLLAAMPELKTTGFWINSPGAKLVA